jgi:hypothetical protein
MAQPAPKRCPRCSNALALAALNNQHLWCSICAVEFDLGANELPENIKPPAETVAPPEPSPSVVTVRDAAAAGAASPGLALPAAPAAAVPVKQSGGRLLTVTAGDLSFSASPPFTFRVGKTKVSVE